MSPFVVSEIIIFVFTAHTLAYICADINSEGREEILNYNKFNTKI